MASNRNYTIKTGGDIPADIRAAILLATGADFNDIPLGTQFNWNRAARDGAFTNTKTVGDMARAFLFHRLGVLVHVEGA
jgi:hypothetical protein